MADAGPGAPPEHLPHLFDKFYQAEGPQHGGNRGVGLGLAISKGLVEAHGGNIRARNQPSGGLEVAFTLPIVEGRNQLPIPDSQNHRPSSVARRPT